MKGWIKIHRELLDKPIWLLSTPEQKVILLTLLLMANHDENEWEWKGERFSCKPGQFITSLDKIAQKVGRGVSIQNVRTALLRFKKYEFLTNESTKQNRLITICNWEQYQSNESDVNKDSNSQLTDDQQTTNNQLTTNKNDKEYKNEKNIINAEFEIFFNAYHSITKLSKTDKQAAEKYFIKLSKKDRQKALDNIKPYFDSLRDKSYCKKCRTYLSDKNYNDEFNINNNQIVPGPNFM